MNRKQYEQYLNELYSDCTFRQIEQSFDYLTRDVRLYAGRIERSTYCRRATLNKAFRDGKTGTLIRKYDTVRFNTGYNDINR